MPDQVPSNTSFSQLPYLDEYLHAILRPRAERTLQVVSKALNESVWQHLVRLLTAEQPAATDATPAMIRSLLEDRLGLRIEVSLSSSFAEEATAPQKGESQAPQVVISAKPATALPLANAVLSGSGRDTRR